LAAKPVKAPTTATLTIYGFDGVLNTELVLYTKGAHEDGFLNDYKMYTEGKKQEEGTGIEQCNLLEEANFTALKPRRDPATNNGPMIGPQNFWRKLLFGIREAAFLRQKHELKGWRSSSNASFRGSSLTSRLTLSTQSMRLTSITPRHLICSCWTWTLYNCQTTARSGVLEEELL
jgi:hypothetical protein